MRLIDADTLVDTLTRLSKDEWNQKAGTSWANALEDCTDIIDNAPTVDTPKELICSVNVSMDTDEVLARLKERGWEPVEHGRWIPCNERLPEIGSTYIVTGIQKDPHEKEWHYFVDVASNYGDYIDDYWDTFHDWIEGQETHIVAWMPLPEPYKMGGDEE